MNFIKLYLFPSIFLCVLLAIKLFETYTASSFAQYGLRPRELENVLGIFLFPLFHGSWSHVLSNAFSLSILFAILFYRFHSIAHLLFTASYILPGVITWIFARDAYHIGASGIVYFCISFIIFFGFLKKERRLLALSFMILFFYSGFIWGMIPQDNAISWETHISGFITGMLCAILLRNKNISSYTEKIQNSTYSTQSISYEDFAVSYTVKQKNVSN